MVSRDLPTFFLQSLKLKGTGRQTFFMKVARIHLWDIRIDNHQTRLDAADTSNCAESLADVLLFSTAAVKRL